MGLWCTDLFDYSVLRLIMVPYPISIIWNIFFKIILIKPRENKVQVFPFICSSHLPNVPQVMLQYVQNNFYSLPCANNEWKDYWLMIPFNYFSNTNISLIASTLKWEFKVITLAVLGIWTWIRLLPSSPTMFTQLRVEHESCRKLVVAHHRSMTSSNTVTVATWCVNWA